MTAGDDLTLLRAHTDDSSTTDLLSLSVSPMAAARQPTIAIQSMLQLWQDSMEVWFSFFHCR